MGRKYSFLKDELAIIEIRKHQWIEGEKQGREIGFATAAVDWIKTHGEAWLEARLSLLENQNNLKEKRRYRRFNYTLPIQLTINDKAIIAEAKTISLVGISCAVSECIPDQASIDVTLAFPGKGRSSSSPKFQFRSRIFRVSKPSKSRKKKVYDIFLPFTEEIRDYIRSYSGLVID